MTGKVISVLAKIEVPCKQCGQPWCGIAQAPVVDGKIAAEAECDVDAEIICDQCVKLANRAYRRDLSVEKKRRQWADGSVISFGKPK